MQEDTVVLREYVESLGLDKKEELTRMDIADLHEALLDGDEFGLAAYVKNLGHPSELSDLIVNVLYG